MYHKFCMFAARQSWQMCFSVLNGSVWGFRFEKALNLHSSQSALLWLKCY